MHLQRISVFTLFLLFTLSGVQTAEGQFSASASDSAGIAINTGRAFRISCDSLPAQKHLHFRCLAVPTAMIAYGIIGLRSDGIQNVNEWVKERVWSDHAHKPIHFDDYLEYAPTVAVYGLNVAGVKGLHNFGDRTIIYGISTAVIRLVVPAIKKNSREMRPDGSDQYSFPSGHTATAFAAAEFMRREYKDASPWYGIGGYAAAAATGYLRLYNNKHWLSDVVAGAGVGILSTDFAYLVLPPLKKLFSGRKSSSTLIMPAYRRGNIGLSAVRMF